MFHSSESVSDGCSVSKDRGLLYNYIMPVVVRLNGHPTDFLTRRFRVPFPLEFIDFYRFQGR